MIPGNRSPLVNSANPELRMTPGSRISVCLREPGVRVIQRIVPFDSGNPGFRLTSGTRGSVWLQEREVPNDSGNPDFLWLRNPGDPNDSSKCSGWLRETRFPRDSGKPEFRVSPATRSPLGDSGSLELQVTPWTRISGWICKPIVPSDSGKSFGRLRKTGFPCASGDPDFRVAHPYYSGWFSASRSSGWLREPESSEWLREPGFAGDSVNPGFLVTL